MTVRAMLEGAERAVANRSPVDGITPTVLLDATVERAAHFVAASLGIHVGPRDGGEELVPKISAQLGGVWAPRMLPEIKLLHRARNAAQHEGLSPDPARLPSWSLAVDAFVRSIVDAQFGVDLERVALSDAISDAHFRDRAITAAGYLASGEYALSVRESRGVVAEAGARWQLLHGSRRATTSASPPAVARLLGGDLLRGEVERLATLTDLTAFARDAADAAWFDALAGVPDPLLDLDDAERALGFATWWLIGFEAASSTWVADRQHRRNIALRAVRDSERPARIDTVVSLRPAVFGEGWDLTVRLADLPSDESWRDWTESVVSLLNPPSRTPEPQWFLGDDGTASIRGVDESGVLADLQRLQEALLTADGAATATAEAAAAAEESRLREDHAFIELVAAAGALPTWVYGIAPVRVSWAPDLLFARVNLDPRALQARVSPQNGQGLLIHTLRTELAVDDIQSFGNRALEIRGALDPRHLVEVLNGLDSEIMAAIAVVAEAEQRLEQNTAQLGRIIQDAIADLGNRIPDPGA